MRSVVLTLGAFVLVAVMQIPAGGFMAGGAGEGCGAGECKDCHSLTQDEASTILKELVDEVQGVRFSEVGGLWEIDVLRRGRRIPIYLDYSKQFVISGQIVRLATKQNITQDRFRAMNTIDVAQIPLDDAIVVGKADAPIKVIVFDDPVCPYCKKLHDEMKKLVERRPDIAFYIKLYPLTKIHPDAYQKAKAIVCEKSAELLELSLSGGALPAPTCETDTIDRNIELAGKLGVRTTPTLIMPDGLVVPGFKDGDTIERLLEGKGAKPGSR